MSLMPPVNGEYDENGLWESHKKCFVYCGDACDCGPPLGQHYNPVRDQQLKLEPAQPPQDTDGLEWVRRLGLSPGELEYRSWFVKPAAQDQ